MAVELNHLQFKRALVDFEFFCRYIKIVNKQSKLIKFELNHVQKLLIPYLYKPRLRLNILKCRQRGVSTLLDVFGLDKCVTRPNFKGAHYLHRFPPTREFGRKYQIAYRNLPLIFKNPKTDKPGLTEFQIPDLNSFVKFVTAGQRGASSRSETLNFLHLSEPAFYENLTETLTAARDSVPDEDNTWLILESTPNTIADAFAKLWFATKNGLSEFENFFYPWHADPESIINDPFLFEPWEPTDEEIITQTKYDLTVPQMKWRRRTIQRYILDGEGNGLKIFKREHPESDTDCFMASESAFFPTEIIQDHIARYEIDTRNKVLSPQKGIDFFQDAEQRRILKDAIIIFPVEKDHKYGAGIDTSEGLDKGDFQACVILDLDTGQQVAQINTKKDLHAFTEMVNLLCRYYNDAICAIEWNNHGQIVVDWLIREFDYPNMYHSSKKRDLGGSSPKYIGRYGFYSTGGMEINSKRYIMDNLSHSLTIPEVFPNNITLLEQLLHYQEKDRKLSAPDGMFDDLVVALAIAYNCRSQQTNIITIFDFKMRV